MQTEDRNQEKATPGQEESNTSANPQNGPSRRQSGKSSKNTATPVKTNDANEGGNMGEDENDDADRNKSSN